MQKELSKGQLVVLTGTWVEGKRQEGQGRFGDHHGPCLPSLTCVAPTDWMQEYHCLLTLEGLQTIVGQCLHRIQALQAGEVLAQHDLC